MIFQCQKPAQVGEQRIIISGVKASVCDDHHSDVGFGSAAVPDQVVVGVLQGGWSPRSTGDPFHLLHGFLNKQWVSVFAGIYYMYQGERITNTLKMCIECETLKEVSESILGSSGRMAWKVPLWLYWTTPTLVPGKMCYVWKSSPPFLYFGQYELKRYTNVDE